MITPPNDQPIVLIVDDDPGTRLVLGAYLEQQGFRVREAESGEQALASFEQARPDLVLLDIMMPGLDGYEVCRAMRECPGGSQVPIVMMTSLDDDDSIHRAYAVGATDFATKPLNHTLLGHRMRYVLRAHRYLSQFDKLTGLPTRGVFLDSLRHAILAAERHRRALAVVYVDLDKFRDINDSLGFEVGDQVIGEVAARLQASVRGSDVLGHGRNPGYLTRSGLDAATPLARIGGDQFVVTLTDLGSPADAARVAARFITALTLPVRTPAGELAVSASIGISTYPEDGSEADALLKCAEDAIREHKDKGRSGYSFYSRCLDDQNQRRAAIARRLRLALPRGDLHVHYQPRLDLRSGDVVCFEALMRWSDPELGRVGPDEFIPIAEDTGLILPMGHWLLGVVCETLADWRRRGLPRVRVSVNLSPTQFRQRDLAEQIAATVQCHGLTPDAIELEITEGVLVKDVNEVMAVLGELKQLGVGLVIDDFGTGYSSLSYLKRLPLDGLKIDKSFVGELATSTDDAAIVSATVALGHNLGLRITAEGVEDLGQLTFLRAYGCDEVQGYLFGKPMPAREALEWAGRRRPPAASPDTDRPGNKTNQRTA